MNKCIQLSEEKFETVISGNQLVLVDFWAPWCHPCSMIAQTIEDIANEYGSMRCVKVNIDENRNLAVNFQIFSIPTLLIFKNGKVVDRIVGAVPKSYIAEKIKRYL